MCYFYLLFSKVDAHAEECFFDRVKKGTKMGLMFEVAEGGFLDIDVRIEGSKFFFTYCMAFSFHLN